MHTQSNPDRYRRPNAITVTAMCVLAGSAVALAAPGSSFAAHSLPSVAAPDARPSGPAVPRPPSRIRGLRSQVIRHASSATLAASLKQVRSGEQVTFTGTVNYSTDLFGQDIVVGNQPVVLEAQRGSTWDTVATSALSDGGTATFTIRPTAGGVYRLAFAGTRRLDASTSSTVAIPLASPSPPSTVARAPMAFSGITSASGTAGRVLAIAAAQSGKPYVYAAAGPGSFDCSGLTQYVFGQVGVYLPHNADEQKSYGVAVSASAALPGDLVVFLDGGYGYHVGIYAGNGMMYDAPHSGTTVGLHEVYSSNVVFRRLV